METPYREMVCQDAQQDRIDLLQAEVEACHAERDQLLLKVEGAEREVWLLKRIMMDRPQGLEQ